jgi:hypothetical protein
MQTQGGIIMKTTVLLSTLAVGLIVAAQSFAQGTNSGPSYPYPPGYQDSEAGGAHWTGHGDQGRSEHR